MWILRCERRGVTSIIMDRYLARAGRPSERTLPQLPLSKFTVDLHIMKGIPFPTINYQRFIGFRCRFSTEF
jgi:hypothetical protein